MKAAQESKQIPKTTKVEGVALPNVEIVMDDGMFTNNLNFQPKVCYINN